jgi:hypothetical protein
MLQIDALDRNNQRKIMFSKHFAFFYKRTLNSYYKALLLYHVIFNFIDSNKKGKNELKIYIKKRLFFSCFIF